MKLFFAFFASLLAVTVATNNVRGQSRKLQNDDVEEEGVVVLAELFKKGDEYSCKPVFRQVQGEASRDIEPGNLGLTSGGGVKGCNKCYAFCQTITILGSTNNGYDLGGGMTPSQCADLAQAQCSGWNTILTGWSCTN